jgi:hypothetical protein
MATTFYDFLKFPCKYLICAFQQKSTKNQLKTVLTNRGILWFILFQRKEGKLKLWLSILN